MSEIPGGVQVISAMQAQVTVFPVQTQVVGQTRVVPVQTIMTSQQRNQSTSKRLGVMEIIFRVLCMVSDFISRA